MRIGLGIGITNNRRASAPASIFANGENGSLLEAPTLDTLYTDDAGTTQATTGDPVAVWSDGSGNGNDATQTELANRMVVSGTGPYYLNPDAVNDNFSIPLGAGFTGDFCLILDTGPIFGSIDTGANTTWNYTINPAYIPDGNIHALIVVDRAFTSAEKQGLVDHYANAVTSAPSTARNAFRNRTDLTVIDTSYGDWTQVTDAEAAFRYCENLATAYVSNWTQVTNARVTFQSCTGLITADVSGWTQVTNAFATFDNCPGFTIPPDVSGWTQVTNAAYTFRGCSGLASAINLDNWNPTILTDGLNMMLGISAAGFDQAAYDSALTAWDIAYDLTTVKTLSIHFGSAKYGSGAPATARGILDTNGWTITDGGFVDPGALFASSEQGAWYDPSDLTTLYQDSVGTTAVTADGDPVGLMLDKSQGLELGPELVEDGRFDDGTVPVGWSIDTADGLLSIVNGRLQSEDTAGTNYIVNYVLTGLSVGTFYKVEWNHTDYNGVGISETEGSFTNFQNFKSTGGDRVAHFKATQTTMYLYWRRNNGTQESVDNVSVRELPGNHATQSTSSARPVYRTDGTLHWLEFDGVDDWLETPSVDLTGTGEVFVVGAGRKEKAAGSIGPIIMNAATGSTDGAFAIYAPHNSTDREFAWSISGAGQHFLAVDGAEYENPVDYVMAMQGDITKSTATTAIAPRWNGQDQSSFSAVVDGVAGTNFLNETFRIGRQESSFYEGRISGIVVVGRKATQNEVSQTEQYLADRTGVTL